MACLAAHQPDIVFLTLEMPRVSGMIIAKQIEAEKGPHPAIVFVTGQRDFISDAAAQCPRLSGQAGYGR